MASSTFAQCSLRVISASVAVACLRTRFSGFSNFLEQFLMEHIKSIYSLESKLFFICTCSIRIRSRTRDILEILRSSKMAKPKTEP